MSGREEPLEIVTFAGLSNLPMMAAQHNGLFAKHGISIEVTHASNSQEQRNGLAEGRFAIALGAVDNAVAQVENQQADAVIVCGGDSGLNQLFVRPEIAGFDDIRGKTVVVDAPNTAYALLLFKMLRTKGLERARDYRVEAVGSTRQRLAAMRQETRCVAGMLTPPFSIEAEKYGYVKCLGSPLPLTGSYQGNGAWVLRSWARDNAGLLVRFLVAMIEGARWTLDPSNEDDATRLLAHHLKLAPDIALASYRSGLDPESGGFSKDLGFSIEGFKTVLSLRAELESQWGGTSPEPDRYIDLCYYRQALTRLNQGSIAID